MQTHNGLLLFIALNEWLFRDTANVDLFHALVLPSQALRSFFFTDAFVERISGVPEHSEPCSLVAASVILLAESRSG